MSVRPSICPFVRSPASLFGDHLCGLYLRTAHAAAGHGFKYLEWQYNISVCPVVLRHFPIFVFVFISSVGVQLRDAFIPQWGLVELIYLSVHLVVRVSF